jgi:hypothetical protein
LNLEMGMCRVSTRVLVARDPSPGPSQLLRSTAQTAAISASNVVVIRVTNAGVTGDAADDGAWPLASATAQLAADMLGIVACRAYSHAGVGSRPVGMPALLAVCVKLSSLMFSAFSYM